MQDFFNTDSDEIFEDLADFEFEDIDTEEFDDDLLSTHGFSPEPPAFCQKPVEIPQPASQQDRSAAFRHAEAPRPYSALRKLWSKVRKKTCAPGFSSRDAAGVPEKTLTVRLQQAGFYKIRTEDLYDLPFSRRDQLGTAAEISIAGEAIFPGNREFPFDSPVVIKVHRMRKASIGFGPQNLKKTNVCDTMAYLNRRGFGNVKAVPICDLKMGWLKIDGQVEKLMIDGFDRFKPEFLFSVDTEILIYYHTYRGSAPL